MKIQSFGSEAPTHHKDNLSMEYTGKTGNPLFESFATEAPIKSEPSATWPINPGCGQPTEQFLGTSAPISRRPVKNWGSTADVVESDRAIKQSY
jgi:hypothetical protein